MSVRLRACLLLLTVFGVLSLIGPAAHGGSRLLAVADEHAEGAAGEEGHATGPPMGFQKDLALWSLVTFLVFLFVLRKLVWGPLAAGLDKREGQIRQDISDAENARLKAEQMLVEHRQKLDQVQDEVKEILAEARRDADQARQNIMQTAQAEAEATKRRAIVDIERARDQALNELFDVMSGQVATATEYVLGHGLKPSDQDQLIQQALAQLGSETKA